MSDYDYLDDSAIIFDDNKLQPPANDNSDEVADLYKELDERLRTQEDKPSVETEVEKLKQQLDDLNIKIDVMEDDDDEENEGANEKEEYLENGDEISDLDTDIDTKVSVLDTDEAGYLGETEDLGVVRSDDGSINMTRVENPVVDGDDASGIPYKNLEVVFPDDADELVGIDAEATAGYIGANYNDGVLRTNNSIKYVDNGDFVTLSVDEYVASQIASIPDSPDVKVASQAGQTAGYLGDVLVCADTSVDIAVVAGTVTLSVVDYVALQIASIPAQTYFHENLTDVSSDQHHNKLHAHDGVDGSGTVSYNDLSHTPIIPIIPDHNNLGGKDGGTDTGGAGLDEKEYYHITKDEWNDLTNNNGTEDNADGQHIHDLSAMEGNLQHDLLDEISGSTTDEYYHLSKSEYDALSSGLDGTEDNADGQHIHDLSAMEGAVNFEDLNNIPEELQPGGGIVPPDTSDCDQNDFPDPNDPDDPDDGGSYPPIDDDPTDPNNPDNPDDGTSHPSDPDCYSTVPDPIT